MTFERIQAQAVACMNEPPEQAQAIFDRALRIRMKREQTADRQAVALAMYQALRDGTSDYWE